jgi:hypothetical protein
VGVLFQWVGVVLFIMSLFVCCGSALLSRDTATQTDLARFGWGGYSGQRAATISLMGAVFFGMALAGVGLGLQAQSRRSPLFAVLLCAVAMAFWLVHALFFFRFAEAALGSICTVLALMFGFLLGFAAASRREMSRTPPPSGLEILPPDYKVPYSHLHEDPPEVRLERELEQRRQRLAVQQKELEMLEQKLRRKLQQRDQ